MSARSPMWFCHQCHAEMRPLMAPDPVCASCRSSFVEKIEDPQDDPRQFAAPAPAPPPGDHDAAGFDNFLIALQTLLNRGMDPADHPPRQQPPSRMTFQFGNVAGHPRQTTVTFGTSPSPPGAVPSMSEFMRSAPSPFPPEDTHATPQINGHLFSQYLMSLLGQTNHPMMPLFMGGGMPESGRMGDYVFSQDALDQIITQIMDSTNTNRPVPATEEIVERLPQEVLMADSPLLTKDCAVCKDQFELGTEDPEQQIVITLPCKHPFHKMCILPWLKSSGTCPVCRYALVPQPGQPTSPNPNDTPASSSSSPRPNTNDARPRSQSPPSSPRQSPRSTTSGSVPARSNFASLFGLGGSPRHFPRPSSSFPQTPTARPSSPNSRPADRTSSSSRSGSRNDQPRNSGDRRPHFPGQWTDDMSDLD
ncbi:hypothetical protein Agabi119p4_306 [Agaricus bisporus var. burnettii]|uniref:RING-type domain-containing protein n=1 Tax=Agaricus bisporus var. burnettii TaxID=192524 RepID=A0A8H7FAK3_AGABI|nr:hypothetical protein Agabi119p4_306 [Agaricus bisporus var. burnettii]